MIRANELRIGNWVGYKHLEKKDDDSIMLNEFIEISSIGVQPDKSVIKQYHAYVTLKNKEHFGIDVSQIFPIPLTPEILEKAGFEYNNEESADGESMIEFWEKNKIRVLLDGRCMIEYVEFDITIKHLHQLQNLYFCLCGEELNIQL